MTSFKWVRSTASVVHECSFCQADTNRVVAFKKPEADNWISVFICDDCLGGVKGVQERKPADA